jgi:hypothetical protein
MILCSLLISLSSLSVARAYPEGDPRNYINMGLLQAHQAVSDRIRQLIEDLKVLPFLDAEKVLASDFDSLRSDYGGFDIPLGEVYLKIQGDEKALEPSLRLQPVTKKKFHRDEQALDSAIKGWDEANN